MTRQIDVSLKTTDLNQRIGHSAVLSADENHYTLTATDSPLAGKFIRNHKSARARPFLFRVDITNDKGSGSIHSLTKDTLIVLLGMLLAASVALATFFLLDWAWWFMPAPLSINALIIAYLAQKTYAILSMVD